MRVNEISKGQSRMEKQPGLPGDENSLIEIRRQEKKQKKKRLIELSEVNIILALVPLYVMACFYYGLRPLFLGASSVVFAVLIDLLCLKLRGKKWEKNDFSAVITGMVLPLFLPATASIGVVFTGIVLAIAVAKHPFGGNGNYIFNPMAVGIAFVTISWSATMLKFPVPLSGNIPMFAPKGIALAAGPSSILKLRGLPTTNMLDMLLGNVPAAMGAAHILVILAGCLYLISRKAIKWQMPVAFIAAVCLVAFLFPRVPTNGFDAMFYELCSGNMLLGVVFVASDQYSAPKWGLSGAIFGVGLGVITMLFRYFGIFDTGFCFALLIMNALTPYIDRIASNIQFRTKGAEL